MTDHSTYRCPGCGRAAKECNAMPCLMREVALQRGIGGAAAWFRLCGYTVRVRNGNIHLSPRKEQRS